MGKPTICIGEKKGADQLRGNCEVTAKLISAFVFATWIVQFLYFLNPEFPASYQSFVTLQPGLCRTWLEPKLLVYSRTGSFK